MFLYFYSLNSSAFHLRMSVTCIKERIVNGNQFSISINSINFFNLKPICLILFHLYCCLDTVLRNGTFSSGIGQSERTAVGSSMFYYINNLSFLHCGRLSNSQPSLSLLQLLMNSANPMHLQVSLLTPVNIQITLWYLNVLFILSSSK